MKVERGMGEEGDRCDELQPHVSFFVSRVGGWKVKYLQIRVNNSVDGVKKIFITDFVVPI